MKIVYSFNKTGFEAEYWTREIAAASDGNVTFVPFNHEPYVNPVSYGRAQALDDLYYAQHPGLMRLYGDVLDVLAREQADAILVDNANPYHPDWLLKNVRAYKVLRTSDGPLRSYDRDFPYVHAFDHVLFHSRAHSRDLGMEEKLRYVGARRADFWPLGLFDRMFDPTKTEETIMENERDIDVIFVGALFVDKMPILAKVKKAFGKRVRLFGLSSWKRNVYFNARFGMPGWVRPIAFDEYIPLYQRTKIGINVHNRGKYTIGSYRMFELPANGVMQICDGDEYLPDYYEVGKEVVGYSDGDDLVRKVQHYLDHPEERKQIAANGFRAVLARHRMRDRLHEAATLIRAGMARPTLAGHAAPERSGTS